MWLEPRHLLKIWEYLLLSCVEVTVVLVNEILVALPEIDQHVINLRGVGFLLFLFQFVFKYIRNSEQTRLIDLPQLVEVRLDVFVATFKCF
jgi:hypothetical protein